MKGKGRITLGLFGALVAVALIALFAALGRSDIETGGDKVVRIPAGIDHREYDRLLKKYVDEKRLVAYAEWRAHNEDRQALNDYLAQFAPATGEAAAGEDLSASLINGYNAFMMKTVLDQYPIDSIMELRHPFDGRRLMVGGEHVSPDDIEHATLIPHFGYRSHVVLVCVARSCPPLRREAYLPSSLDDQADDSFRTWLARDDLNRFLPHEGRVEISSIFDWFDDDLEETGGVRRVLERYAPEEFRDFLGAADYEIAFIPYNWALNDQQLREFSRVRQGWNRFLDFLR